MQHRQQRQHVEQAKDLTKPGIGEQLPPRAITPHGKLQPAARLHSSVSQQRRSAQQRGNAA
jgi:hypothetical protein